MSTTVPDRSEITRLRVTYDPDLSGGTSCACGQIIGAVRAINADTGQPLCTTCLGGEEAYATHAQAIEGLDLLDRALYESAPSTAGLLAMDATDFLPRIIDRRTAAGRKPRLGDDLFLRELVHRLTTSGRTGEKIMAALATVVPDLPTDRLAQLVGENLAEVEAAAAVATAEQGQMEAALLIMGRAQNPVNVGDAVGQLGIDMGMFVGRVQAAALEHRCDVRDLPAGVVDAALAAAGCGEA